MKGLRRILIFLLAAVMLLSLPVFASEEDASAPDYDLAESWAYFALGEDTGVDIFLICPTVDTRSERNSFDLNDKLKGRFVSALDMEKGIYEEAGRLYSPYYRQMSMNAYKLSEEERAEALAVARSDVFAAFRWYLDHENGGRGIILAGFSQGAQMCLELMKEYYGGDGDEAAALRKGLVTVYAIGWSVTEEMAAEYPQIIPAKGETDVGTVVSFDCEDGTLTETLVIPAGTRALSINPLNWRTDGEAADASRNLGAVMATGAEPIPGLCGAYIGERGELVVPDVSPADYPPAIDIFPEGAYHVYDYLFFFTNLKENIAKRVQAWRGALPFADVPAGAWYRAGVEYAYEAGLMEGTDETVFDPQGSLTRPQLISILWDLAGSPAADGSLPYGDVAADAWYAPALGWALANGITDRTGGEFDPDGALQRDEAVYLLWNTAKYLGAEAPAGEGMDLSGFTDAAMTREAYAAAMQWAVGTGLIRGIGGGLLAPQYQLTRAQTAVMLRRFADAA